VIVTGTSATPSGQIAQRTTTGIAFNVGFAPGSVAQQPATTPTTTAQAPQVSPAPRPSSVTGPALQPNPGVNIDGQSASVQRLDPVPPFLPRAIAPPVGDISIATLETSPTIVDLGSAQRIPRLVLRDAPAREVLSLLARAAGLNLAYTSVKSSAITGASAPSPGDEGPKVTLDVENEPVQDVFNNVLRITGLQASRTGRTLLVGPDLPDDSKSIITRTFRLNQAKAETVGSFLSTQGATTLVPVTKISIQTIGEGDRKRDIEVREPGITSIEAKKSGPDSGPIILKGLTVSVDSRLNSVTISGESRKLDLAGQMILRLDARQRQVAVNVKVLDINLSAITRAGSSFSFGVAGSRFLSQGGIGVFNFDTNNGGRATPGADFTLVPSNVGAIPSTGAFQSGSNKGPGSNAAFGFNVVKDFVGQLQATVNNGNAKILTDPTIIVQEGQTAEVNLTQEVVTKIEEETETVGLSTRTKLKITKENAGLALAVRMEKIDDNGFVSLQVSPSIKNIYDTAVVRGNSFALLAERKINSGTIRLRDNQSLILSGIIQDQDRVSVQKVPILGDLPILGSLFRRTSRDSERREVIVLLTPQIMDDSDRSTFGYAYVPGADARRALEKK
jgi:type IV pilus assembly protein PilQ